MKIVIRVLLIIAIVLIVILILRKFKNPREEFINFIDGGNGSGKSSSFICRLRRFIFRRYFIWRNFNIKNDYIIISSFPIGMKKKHSNEFLLDNDGDRYIKVLGRKFKCFDLDLDILLMQKRLPQNEIILCCDEFHDICDQFSYMNPCNRYNLLEFFSKFRHFTNGLGIFYGCDQSIADIFVQVRRRGNFCYNMVSCHKIKFLPITIYEYRKILLSDVVDNVVQVSDATDETDLRKFIFFCNPFKYYDSYCYSERYLAVKEVATLTSIKSQKRNDVIKLRIKNPLYYECLKYDGITKDEFLLLASNKK